MLGLRHHFQIGVIVVPFIFVLVVDDLSWFQGPAQHLFRLNAVHVPAFVLDVVLRTS